MPPRPPGSHSPLPTYDNAQERTLYGSPSSQRKDPMDQEDVPGSSRSQLFTQYPTDSAAGHADSDEALEMEERKALAGDGGEYRSTQGEIERHTESYISYGGTGTFEKEDIMASPLGSPDMRTVPVLSHNQHHHHRQVHQYPPHPEHHRKEAAKWGKLMDDAGYVDAKTAPDSPWVEAEKRISGFLAPLRRLANKSLLLRIVVLVIPITALLWIPGIIALTIYHASAANSYSKPAIWEVGLFWWSVWLSIVWVGWWGCSIIAMMGPGILKASLGAVVVEARHYIAYFTALERYMAITLWCLLIWITWLTVIWAHFTDPYKYAISGATVNPLISNTTLVSGNSTLSSSPSNSTMILASANSGESALTVHMVTAGRFWLGLFMCALLLLLEKFFIQTVAWQFHETSYAARIAESRFHIEVLTTLYVNSRSAQEISIKAADLAANRGASKTAGWSRARQNFRKVATKSKSVLGLAASEITGGDAIERDPSSPRNIVVAAFQSTRDTKALGRSIFRALSHCAREGEVPDHSESQGVEGLPVGATEEKPASSIQPLQILTVSDIERFFPNRRCAQAAFELFDRNLNGSAVEEEVENACMEAKMERETLTSSMRDVDSAVGNLDHLFMSVYTMISLIIIAALISSKFSTLIASFGSALLGLSWLLSSSAQEALTGIVFLFVKHPYDVGDRVDIGTPGGSDFESFIVKEMQLLTTTFQTVGTGQWTTMSHTLLVQKQIINMRRSGPTVELFEFEVGYATTFDAIEELRGKMLTWVEKQPRDFAPGLNIEVLNLGKAGSPGAQDAMTLRAGIRYKTNTQSDDLRSRRKNRWLCQLKVAMAESGIAAPGGTDPYAVPDAKKPLWRSDPSTSKIAQSVRGGPARDYAFMDDRADLETERLRDQTVLSTWTQSGPLRHGGERGFVGAPQVMAMSAGVSTGATPDLHTSLSSGVPRSRVGDSREQGWGWGLGPGGL